MTNKPDTIDELFDLARTDPEALEVYRQEQISEIIAQAPPYMRKRLEGLQFTIDAHRRTHHNPLAVCIEISKMMHESFSELRGLLNILAEGGDLPDTEPQHSATIIPFPAR